MPLLLFSGFCFLLLALLCFRLGRLTLYLVELVSRLQGTSNRRATRTIATMMNVQRFDRLSHTASDHRAGRRLNTLHTRPQRRQRAAPVIFSLEINAAVIWQQKKDFPFTRW